MDRQRKASLTPSPVTAATAGPAAAPTRRPLRPSLGEYDHRPLEQRFGGWHDRAPLSDVKLPEQILRIVVLANGLFK